MSGALEASTERIFEVTLDMLEKHVHERRLNSDVFFLSKQLIVLLPSLIAWFIMFVCLMYHPGTYVS